MLFRHAPCFFLLCFLFIRTICDNDKTEIAVVRKVGSMGQTKEKLGGIQALVSYDIIEELNEWFKEVDYKGKGKLNRFMTSTYFKVRLLIPFLHTHTLVVYTCHKSKYSSTHLPHTLRPSFLPPIFRFFSPW